MATYEEILLTPETNENLLAVDVERGSLLSDLALLFK